MFYSSIEEYTKCVFLIPGPDLGLVHDLVQDLGLVDAAIARVHAAVATVGRYYVV